MCSLGFVFVFLSCSEGEKKSIVTQRYVDSAINGNVSCLAKVPNDILTVSNITKNFDPDEQYGENMVISTGAAKASFALAGHGHNDYVPISSVKYHGDADKSSEDWKIPSERQVNQSIADLTSGFYKLYNLGNSTRTDLCLVDRVIFLSVVMDLDNDKDKDYSVIYRGILEDGKEFDLGNDYMIKFTVKANEFSYAVSKGGTEHTAFASFSYVVM